MAVKQCCRCGTSKEEESEFYRSSRGRGFHSWCKKCHNKQVVAGAAARKAKDPEKYKKYMATFQREARMKRPEVFRRCERNKTLKKFGKNHKWYEETHAAQGGLCAICKRPETTVDDRTGKLKSLAIDHDHSTNQVRGLLCVYCNTALHNVERAPNWPARAAAYLRRFRPDPVEVEMQLPFDI